MSNVVTGLANCIDQGGVAIGAFSDNDIIGFASIQNGLFGINGDYLQLEMLHVSYEYRNKGIGKSLFHIICAEAKTFGARKLYISAHPSAETQAFYKAIGCIEAVEINKKLFDEEPFDCHLEYCL